jgi:hypothetical protein
MMPLQALLDPYSDKPATIPEYGPLPTDIARDIFITSHGRKWWRRLFTAPTHGKGKTGPIMGGDARRRRFAGWMAELIKLRDQPAALRAAAPRSGTSTTAPGTPTTEPPATATAAVSANAATMSEKCPAGTSPSSTPDSSPNPTPS